jgi:hypothetical protein
VAPPPLERWAEIYDDEPRPFRGGAMILGAVIVAGLVLAVAVAASARRDCADAGGGVRRARQRLRQVRRDHPHEEAMNQLPAIEALIRACEEQRPIFWRSWLGD